MTTVESCTEILENDENQPPLEQYATSIDKLSSIGSTLLRESHRDNIDSRSPTVMKVSAQSSVVPATPPLLTPAVVVEEKLVDVNSDSCDAWDERCTVITRQEHEEYVKFASEVVADLVDSLPIPIEANLTKVDSPVQAQNVSPGSFGVSDRHDTHSICSSADYTPSDSSFDTAREDFQQSLPDLVLLPDGLHGNPEYRRTGIETDKSDTDYESATDIDDSILAVIDPFAASSPRDDLPTVEAVNYLVNEEGISEFVKALEEFNQDKTPVASLVKKEVVSDLNLVPFDREKTPVVSNGVFCYSNRNEIIDNSPEVISRDFSNKISGEVAGFEGELLLIENHQVVDEFSPTSVDNSSESLVSCSDSISENREADLGGNENLNLKPFEKKKEEEENSDCSLEVCENSSDQPVEEENLKFEHSSRTLVGLFVKELTKEDIVASFAHLENVSENKRLEEVVAVQNNSVESTSLKESSPSSASPSLVASPKTRGGGEEEDVVDSPARKESLKVEVDGFGLDERLELEASIIAEELINLSLLENETVLEEGGRAIGDAAEGAESESENMRETRMADVENNEHVDEDVSSSSGGKMDENVNPFQAKSKLSNSPASKAVKNGEVSSAKATTPNVEVKKNTPVRRPNPGMRGGLANASPKRKGSVGDVNGVSPVASKEENSESQVFKKPLPKQHPTLPRPSGNAASPESPQLPDQSEDVPVPVPGAMVRSLEDEVITEAGPDVAEFSDGEFRSASDVFKDPATFDFLQMAGSKHLSESALARMSLYVKFDPLLKAISPVTKRSVTRTSTSDTSQLSSISDTSDDLLLLGTPKDGEGGQSDENSSTTPSNKNRCMEGRLLDLSPSPFKRTLQEAETNGVGGRRVYSEEEFTQALRMQELLFQEQLLKKDRELDDRVKVYDKEQVETSKRLQNLHETNEEMRKTVLEYEKTISQLIDDREKERQMTAENLCQMKKERDQALDDLQSVESAFADLHRRYEKSKTAVEGFKKNEDVLKNYVKEGQLAVKKQEQKYDLLKHHAEETLERANVEIDALRRTSEAENAALRAQLKKAEMKVDGLEKSLKQKNKENAELTNLCDELIAKVGQANS